MSELLQRSQTILIVDDVIENLRLLSTTLTEEGYQVRCAKNGASGLMGAKSETPDLILLDINMSGIDGYEVCRRLKSDPTLQEIPVIFLSALDDVLDKITAFEVGGIDYITKPFQVAEVLARVKTQLMLRAAIAEIKELNQTLEARVRSRTLELQFTNQKLQHSNQALQREIEERQNLEQQLIYEALYDGLTGLPNRSLLLEHINRALDRNQNQADDQFAILFIDLDRFKLVNDGMGHAVGDQLLGAIAELLQSCIRQQDTVARLGGDEFVILLNNVQSITEATEISSRILEKLALPLSVGPHELIVTASIGIALSTTDYRDSSEIIRDADIAMYRAKEKGKDRYEIFNPAMYLKMLQKIEIERNLRLALERDEFFLCYQPIVRIPQDESRDFGDELSGCELVGFEALVRWQHPEQGMISPTDFIPVAEETLLIAAIGHWVLTEACRQLRDWQVRFGTAAAPLTMSVNVAGYQLQKSDFIASLDQILEQTSLSPDNLILEITERTLVDSESATQETIAALQHRRIKLSIDDFGTGYSSLSYLHRFPVSLLKIDGSFVQRLDTDEQGSNITKTIVTLAESLNLVAIAEGVETAAQLAILKTLGCERAQGYWLAKPQRAEALETLLAQCLNQPCLSQT
jgi:diguanylate cyclase (GGDEF)-like protein